MKLILIIAAVIGSCFANCYFTRYDDVSACNDVPRAGDTLSLPNGMTEFTYEGRHYHQIDLASYFFYTWSPAAFLTRIRHPYLITSTMKSPTGSLAWEIDWRKKWGFYVGIFESHKPRTRDEAKAVHRKGFKRSLMCYSSATGEDMANILNDYNMQGIGYRTFLNSCHRITLYMLERLCGKQVAETARKSLFNIFNAIGTSFSKPRINDPPIYFPYVLWPANSTKTLDLRREIDVRDIANIY
jgi:hypothetical protein